MSSERVMARHGLHLLLLLAFFLSSPSGRGASATKTAVAIDYPELTHVSECSPYSQLNAAIMKTVAAIKGEAEGQDDAGKPLAEVRAAFTP